MSLTDDVYQSLIELGGRDVTTPQILQHLYDTKKLVHTGYDFKITITQALNRMRAWGKVQRVCIRGDHCFHWELGLEQS